MYVFLNKEVRQYAYSLPASFEVAKFPTIALEYPYDVSTIDDYLAYFFAIIEKRRDGQENTDEIIISYPTQEKISIQRIPPDTRYILLENYDKNWEIQDDSYSGAVYIEMYGPSYLSVVNNMREEVDITLVHKFPASSTTAVYLIAAGLLVWFIGFSARGIILGSKRLKRA